MCHTTITSPSETIRALLGFEVKCQASTILHSNIHHPIIHCLVGGIQSDMLRQVWYEGGGAQPHHDLPYPRQELLGSYHHSPLWLPHAAEV